MLNRFAPGVLIIATLAVGCGGEDLDSDDFDALDDAPGLDAQSQNINGKSLNGKSLNGKSLNGTKLANPTLSGVALTNVTLTATVFSGKKGTTSISGSAFVGSVWQGTLSDGTTTSVRIDSRTALAAPNTDVYAYGVSFLSGTSWLPMCGEATTLSIPLAGTWNYAEGVVGGGSWTASSTSFTFACRGAAIAKCVELGYKPWKTVGGTLLQNHQVACTRLLRADYCGDGKSWTVDGTLVNLYDGKGVQADTEAWSAEADWTTTGARYISTKADTRFKQVYGSTPACFTSKLAPNLVGLTTNFSTGTLLISELSGI